MKNTTPAKLKIGFVFDDSLDRNDGVQQYVKTLGAWLSSQGHEVRYLVGETKMTNFKGGKVYSLAKNIKVSFNGNKLSIPMPASKSKIRQVLEYENFDVLHVQTPYSPLMAHKVIKLAPSSTAIVGTFHILPVGKLQTVGTRLLRIWCNESIIRFNQFLAVSPSAQIFAKDSFKIYSLVLPNVVAVSNFKNNSERSNLIYRIVFLGRLVKRKGCEHLIHAAAILNESITNFELIIAGGGGDEQKLKDLSNSLSIVEKVNFLGYVDEKNKANLLGSAHIACFPALYGESFGIVLIEAMASGSEVVLGGNNPGYVSVLGDKPKLLFDPTDHKGLANLLEEFLTNQKLRTSVNDWQNLHVKQFDVAVVGEKLLGHYNRIVEKQRVSAHNRD